MVRAVARAPPRASVSHVERAVFAAVGAGQPTRARARDLPSGRARRAAMAGRAAARARRAARRAGAGHLGLDRDRPDEVPMSDELPAAVEEAVRAQERRDAVI